LHNKDKLYNTFKLNDRFGHGAEKFLNISVMLLRAPEFSIDPYKYCLIDEWVED